jgi:hypothetical protein
MRKIYTTLQILVFSNLLVEPGSAKDVGKIVSSDIMHAGDLIG